jgi:hypothetical protein
MKSIKIFCLLMFLTVTPITMFAQSGLSEILKAYPDWKTNFDKKTIDIGELMSGGPPKDGIPAIFTPKFETQDEASEWLDDKEPVIGLEINGESKAYPLSILIWHEIANDEVGGVPVAVSFCPLCYSALVYDRRVRGLPKVFGSSLPAKQLWVIWLGKHLNLSRHR